MYSFFQLGQLLTLYHTVLCPMIGLGLSPKLIMCCRSTFWQKCFALKFVLQFAIGQGLAGSSICCCKRAMHGALIQTLAGTIML